jgi:hypothetical protein
MWNFNLTRAFGCDELHSSIRPVIPRYHMPTLNSHSNIFYIYLYLYAIDMLSPTLVKDSRSMLRYTPEELRSQQVTSRSQIMGAQYFKCSIS